MSKHDFIKEGLDTHHTNWYKLRVSDYASRTTRPGFSVAPGDPTTFFRKFCRIRIKD